MKKCFVVSPIGEEGSDIRKRADQVFKYIIDPVCNNSEFEAIRVDQLNQSDYITQTILDHLLQDELVIADMTGHNPNAFYEMGFRACTGKPMINLKAKGESIPFDISNMRAFDYDLSDLDSVDEVKKRLEQTIRSFNILEIQEEEELNDQNENNAPEAVNAASDILPVLYDIQDQIGLLREDIQRKDTDTIKAIVNASKGPTTIEDPNTTMMKILLPELLKNPNSIKALMELGNTIQNEEKKK